MNVFKNDLNGDEDNNRKRIIYDRNCIAVPKMDYIATKIKIPTKKVFFDFSDYKSLLKPLKVASMYASVFMITVIVLLSCIYLSGYSAGVEVKADGELICVVKDKAQFNKQFEMFIDELKKYGTDSVNIEQSIEFIGRQVKKEYLSTDAEVLGNIKKMINISVGAYAVVVDNEEMVYLNEETAAFAVLDEMKAPYVKDDDNIQVLFNKDVRIEKVNICASKLNTKAEALEILSCTKDETKKYEIKQGDTLWEIASAYGTSVSEILRINPGITEDIQPDQEVNLTVPNPVLGVETRERIVYNEHIPFSVEVKDDPNNYKGRRTVVDKGYNGEKEIEALIVSVNGIEQEKKIINEVVLIEPKKQVEKIGSKPLPPKFGSGIFAHPSYGMLTSRFGSRGGRMHTGIDIGGKTGDPIYAADGGKVIYTGWDGGYGYIVKISHDNEYESWYAHCSKILVSQGQRVGKGETIARVGNTGRSTGPHLHFEIRKNGVPQNPLSYLN
jgi:murein DD-endopeptidase MepM/ murein hydrolase activator NlpD